MAKAKAKPAWPFSGRWHIVSMTEWDEDFINAEVQGSNEFDDKSSGSFQFGYVSGDMDCRLTTRDGQPAVEWTWDGNDEMDHAEGRGWAVLKGDELHGMIFFHEGDESGFVVKRANAEKSKRGKASRVDKDLIVYHQFGNTGLGAARIPKELQQAVIGEIVKQAGLSKKPKGKMQVKLLGTDFEASVKEYDSFGESAFTITLKERKR